METQEKNEAIERDVVQLSSEPSEVVTVEKEADLPKRGTADTMENKELTDAALERLVAEAEERGYLRGRNEKISISMEQWETSVDLAPDLLLTPRKSLWD